MSSPDVLGRGPEKTTVSDIDFAKAHTDSTLTLVTSDIRSRESLLPTWSTILLYLGLVLASSFSLDSMSPALAPGMQLTVVAGVANLFSLLSDPLPEMSFKDNLFTSHVIRAVDYIPVLIPLSGWDKLVPTGMGYVLILLFTSRPLDRVVLLSGEFDIVSPVFKFLFCVLFCSGPAEEVFTSPGQLALSTVHGFSHFSGSVYSASLTLWHKSVRCF